MMLMPKSKPSSYPLSQYGLNTPKKKKWEKATIKSQVETPQSYIVQTSHGDLRRNRVHIKEATSSKHPKEGPRTAKACIQNNPSTGSATSSSYGAKNSKSSSESCNESNGLKSYSNPNGENNCSETYCSKFNFKNLCTESKYEKYSTKIPSSNRTKYFE